MSWSRNAWKVSPVGSQPRIRTAATSTTWIGANRPVVSVSIKVHSVAQRIGRQGVAFPGGRVKRGRTCALVRRA